MNSAYSINERPDPHCEESGPSNLVCACRPPDRKDSIIEPSCLVNPPSRSQRCFRYLDCFDRGIETNLTQETVVIRPDHASRRSAAFKAVYLSTEYRGDNVPHSPYQPHSGSNPAGSCGQKVSSRALMRRNGSGKHGEMYGLTAQGLALL